MAGNRRTFRKIVAKEIRDEDLLGAIGRGWCHPKTQTLHMNVDLAYAIFEEVKKEIAREGN